MLFDINKKMIAKAGRQFARGMLAFVTVVILFTTANVQAAITFRSAASNGTASATGGITHVGAGTAQGLTGCGDINPSIPAGSVNDLLIALVVTKEDDAGNAVAMPGWNTYYFAEYAGAPDNNELQVTIFWRLATGTDPNTITQSGGACSGFGGQISRFSGVDTTQPFETVTPGVVNQASNNLDTGTITTTSATAMLLVAGFISNDRTVTEGAGWTQSFDFAYNDGGAKPDFDITLNYQLQTTAGTKSISNWNFSGGGNDENFGVILALQPSAGSGGLTINVPAGTTTDDVMIAAISVRPSSSTITPPAGWTSLNRVDQGTGNSNAQEIFYRVATGSEPASYAWNFSGTITGAAGGISTYTGVDTSSPIDAFGGNTTANGTTHTANSITTSVADAMVISAHSFSSAETWTPPGGMTEQIDIASLTTPDAAGISLEMNDVLQATAGATGDKTATAAGNTDTGVAQLVALTPLVTASIVVTFTGTVDEINAGSIFLTGTANGGPEATQTYTGFNNSTITGQSITTSTNGTMVVDIIGGGDAGTFSSSGAHTVRWNEAANSATGASSTLQVATAGTTTVNYTHDDTSLNRYAHVLAALTPDTTIAFDSAASTANTNSNNITWSHAVSGSGKLLVGIAVEENACQNGNQVVSSVTHNGTPMTFIASIPTAVNGFCAHVELWYLDFGTPPSLPSPLAEWRMEESSWNGTAGEVVDETGNGYDGTARNGAVTDDISPAVVGDPGTCGYGVFDDAGGTNGDYIELSGFPNQTTDFTVTAWIRTQDNMRMGQRIFADDENNTGGYALSVGDGGTGTVRFYSRNINLVSLDTGGVIANNTWYFIAAVADITSSQRTIYVFDSSGTLVTSVSDTFTGTWGTDAGVASIGGETNSGETDNRFFGNLDEVRVYGSVLSQSQLSSVLSDTHPCPAVTPDVYYTMDETVWGGASTVLDSSGNGNHGSPLGGAAPASPAGSPARTGDPGTAITGYGVVTRAATGSVKLLECGVIRTSSGEALTERIREIYDSVKELIEQSGPYRRSRHLRLWPDPQ